jgi:hypothetical protein
MKTSVSRWSNTIAGRHHIGTGVEQLNQDLLGNAEPAGSVLAVHNYEI